MLRRWNVFKNPTTLPYTRTHFCLSLSKRSNLSECFIVRGQRGDEDTIIIVVKLMTVEGMIKLHRMVRVDVTKEMLVLGDVIKGGTGVDAGVEGCIEGADVVRCTEFVFELGNWRNIVPVWF